MPLLNAIPIFPAQELDSTLAFYLGKLGFNLLFNYGDYAGIQRDNFELHFWVCSDRNVADNTSCRIKTSNLVDLYHEYQAAGVLHPNSALHVKPDGQCQFTIADPNGNILDFFE